MIGKLYAGLSGLIAGRCNQNCTQSFSRLYAGDADVVPALVLVQLPVVTYPAKLFDSLDQ